MIVKLFIVINISFGYYLFKALYIRILSAQNLSNTCFIPILDNNC